MSLQKSARTIVTTCLKIKRNEKILIVTDKKTKKIALAIKKEASKISKNLNLIFIPIPKIHGSEPSTKVSKEMLNYKVIMAPTTMSLTHTNAIKAARKKGARIATLPGITEDIMNLIDIDYKKMKKKAIKLKKILDKIESLELTTSSGTNLKLSTKKRTWITDIGLIHNPGDLSNLPAGEVFIAPDENKTQGTLVIDSFKDNNITYAKKGTIINIRQGKAYTNSKNKLQSLFKKLKNGRNIAELGIGINEKALKVKGNILHDEKMIDTIHIAFGSSAGINGKVYSKMHLDTIVLKPTIRSKNKIIINKGKVL